MSGKNDGIKLLPSKDLKFAMSSRCFVLLNRDTGIEVRAKQRRSAHCTIFATAYYFSLTDKASMKHLNPRVGLESTTKSSCTCKAFAKHPLADSNHLPHDNVLQFSRISLMCIKSLE